MASSEPNGLTPEGERLVKAWVAATDGLEQARSRLTSAQCAIANAANALGQWLCPDDAKAGESFSVWWGDSLITVLVKDPGPGGSGGTFELTLRTRGKHWRRAT